MSRKTVTIPTATKAALTATKAELIARYNQIASDVQTINAAVRMSPTAGSALSGVVEQYHDVNGYILAARPSSIRVIGQAPIVAKDIFDMASDGQTFRIYIPSKNKFIVGPVHLSETAQKPIENLRPQHLFEALMWTEIAADAPVLLEEESEPPEQYYVLTVAAQGPQGWNLDRKIWFERSDLQVARIQIFGGEGEVVSDIKASDWQAQGNIPYPHEILVDRPVDQYQLAIAITNLTLNQPISADRFQLAQPAGTDLVRLGEGKQP